MCLVKSTSSKRLELRKTKQNLDPFPLNHKQKHIIPAKFVEDVISDFCANNYSCSYTKISRYSNSRLEIVGTKQWKI